MRRVLRGWYTPVRIAENGERMRLRAHYFDGTWCLCGMYEFAGGELVLAELGGPGRLPRRFTPSVMERTDVYDPGCAEAKEGDEIERMIDEACEPRGDLMDEE